LESLIESVDKGEHSLGIFMDLSKAFDSVEHSIMIDKLKSLGIKNTSLKWFKSYLANRFQYVEIHHTSKELRVTKVKSNLQPIVFGVPQGSILGPLLFLCYLKNMPLTLTQVANQNLCLYADDANLKISAKTVNQIEVISSAELSNISRFLNEHNFRLNVKKTNFLTFRTQQNRNIISPIITVDNQSILKIIPQNFWDLLSM